LIPSYAFSVRDHLLNIRISFCQPVIDDIPEMNAQHLPFRRLGCFTVQYSQFGKLMSLTNALAIRLNRISSRGGQKEKQDISAKGRSLVHKNVIFRLVSISRILF